MTDRTDHRREAEIHRELAGQVIGHEGTMEHLGLAQFHALLAIHDTLTAADHYAANEARQREEVVDASGDCGFAWAEYRREYQPNPRGLNAAHKAFLAGWEARSEEDWNESGPLTFVPDAECSRCGTTYPGTAEATMEHHRACTGEIPENPMGDPLDEEDHRDRLDGNGDVWGRNPSGCCHTRIHDCRALHCEWTRFAFAQRYGPLTFAPDAAPQVTGDDLSASEGESGSEDGEGSRDAPEALLCPECGHDLEDHFLADSYECPRSPTGVAYALIEQAVKAERLRSAREVREWALADLAERWEQ